MHANIQLFKAVRRKKSSNYDFGYGDGFLRINSNNYSTPDGEELIGRVSMDNSSFLSAKDEIVIFNDARKVANSARTISYEVLTAISQRVKKMLKKFIRKMM